MAQSSFEVLTSADCSQGASGVVRAAANSVCSFPPSLPLSLPPSLPPSLPYYTLKASLSLEVSVGAECEDLVVVRGGCVRVECEVTPHAPMLWTRVDGRSIK